mmetsp:Transcript_7859/g.6954  ORF Transcript_7859/g.6954 Transcript_7859/m.6954 type:complete len:203 (+) Transcript_7859:171-779(+)
MIGLKQYSFLDVICKSICCCKPKFKEMKKNSSLIKSQSSINSFNQDQYKLYKEMDLVKYLNDVKEIKKVLKKLLEPSEIKPEIYYQSQPVEVQPVEVQHQISQNLLDKPTVEDKINSSKISKEEEKEFNSEVERNVSKNKNKELEAIKSINTIVNQEIKQASSKNDTHKSGYEEINQEEVDKKDNNFGVSLRVHSNIFSLII